MRIIRWGLVVIAVAVLLTVGSFSAIIYLPQLNGARQVFAEYALGHTFSREVSVEGQVVIRMGRTIDVELSSISVQSIFSRSPDDPERIDRGSFSVPLDSVLAANPTISELELSGVSMDVFDPDRDASAPSRKAGTIAAFPSSFLNHPISGALTLDDVTLHFIDPDAGLDETVRFNALRSNYDEARNRIRLTMDGELNGSAIALQAEIDNPRKNSNGTANAMEIGLRLPGSVNRFSGSIDTSKPIAELAGGLIVQIDSLGDGLDALQLRRVIEGTGELRARLDGPLDRLMATDIKGSASGTGTNRFKVAGKIEALGTGEGMNLVVSGDLGSAGKSDSAGSMTDRRITGFSGVLSGRYDQLQLDAFVVRTDAFNVELREIGPITIDRIAKDNEGKLGIHGLRILDGPPDQRNLELTGDIADALAMADISLAGKFDLDTKKALSLEGGDETQSLGRFVGEIAMSDGDGIFGIDAFSGSIIDGALIELDVSLIADDLSDLDDIALNADMKIPDFAAFVSALGGTTDGQGGLEFKGSVQVNDEIPTLSGQVIAGDTTIVGSISAERNAGSLRLSGEVQSEAITIADLRNLWEVGSIGRGQDIDYVTVNEGAFDSMALELDVDVGKIAEAGEAVGKIKGHIRLANDRLELDPLSISYLGGAIEASSQLDGSKEPLILSTTGTISKLPVGKLLTQLRLPPLASGSLNAKFDLAGVAKKGAFAKSASGSITASLWGGTIGTNLIDLTGMDYLSWAATKQKDNSTNITCMIVPLKMKGGVGSTARLLLETDNVLLVGKGSINFQNDAIELAFQAIPKTEQTVSVATPFTVSGPLSGPKISIEPGEIQKRVANEMMNLPMNMFAKFFGLNSKEEPEEKPKPCVLPETAKKTGGE